MKKGDVIRQKCVNTTFYLTGILAHKVNNIKYQCVVFHIFMLTMKISRMIGPAINATYMCISQISTDFVKHNRYTVAASSALTLMSPMQIKTNSKFVTVHMNDVSPCTSSMLLLPDMRTTPMYKFTDRAYCTWS